MIALNEPDDYAAEVSFTLPLETDPLTGLSGYAFAPGDVECQFPASPGTWVDIDPARVFEKGYGRFAYRTTLAQRSVAGTITLNAVVAGTQPCRVSETVDGGGGDIAVGGTGWLVFYLADAIDPLYNPPITGTFSGLPGALARVCWPDASYIDVLASSVFEFGRGMFGIPVTTLGTTKAGKAYYYATADGAQRFEGYSTIARFNELPGDVDVIDTPPPVESPYTPSSPLYVDHAMGAIDRLPEQFKAKTN